MRFGMILIVKNPDFYAYSCFMITHSAVFKMHSFGTIWVGCCHLRLGKSAKKKWKKTFSWNIKSLILVYNQNHVLVLGTETKVQFHYPISSYTKYGSRFPSTGSGSQVRVQYKENQYIEVPEYGSRFPSTDFDKNHQNF